MSNEPLGRLWHVTLTVAGEQVEPMLLRAALSRLREERPFIDTVEFTGSSAALNYWDEGAAMLDVASLALRLWSEHRESAGLPNWEIVGLEVVEKSAREARSGMRTSSLGASTSLPFQL
ncbi:MAG: hypothetical protein ACJ72O_13240 [Marmoricola sp.]